MSIAIIPIAEHHIEGFRDAVGEVAREGLFLAALDAPPLELSRKFVLRNIENNNPQFVVIADAKVVGWCDIVRKERPAYRHVGVLGMGVLKAHRGRGIGGQLLDRVVASAWEAGIERVELVVRSDNAVAKRLYDSRGFVVEGVLRRDYCLNDTYHDSYLMALLRTA